jgi:hypothetical protein
LIDPKKLNRSPSEAMAYMHRGSEKREPKSVVVIPHSAPIDTTYLAQFRPILENASGKAALVLMVQ